MMAGENSKYRTDDHLDLVSRIRDLERRLSRMERTPQLPNGGINTGGITVNGGNINVNRQIFSTEEELAAGQIQGNINIGSNTFVNGEDGMAIRISRSWVVDSDYTTPDGQIVRNTDILAASTVEGGVADPDFRFPTFVLYDKSGDVLMADSLNARRGLSDPIWSIPFTDKSLTSTTSGTFSDLAGLEWYFYHPHLRFRLVYFNDASTTGEVEVTEEATGRRMGIITTPAGGPTYLDLIIKRSDLTSGKSPNGNSEILSVGHRRASGAGTVRTRVASIVAIDLSWFEAW